MNGDYSTRHGRLYRSRNGMILGVCRGLADYSDISVCMIRCIMVVLFVLTGFFPIVLIYLGAAVFMRPGPVLEPPDSREWEFYNSWASDRSLALERLKRKFDRLERRTRRMESFVTAKEFDWEERFQTSK